MEKQQKNRIAVISIMSYYARQIFDETKLYEFRKSPIKDSMLNQKIYVYSAKEDKAFSLDGNLCSNPTNAKQIIIQNAIKKGRH